MAEEKKEAKAAETEEQKVEVPKVEKVEKKVEKKVEAEAETKVEAKVEKTAKDKVKAKKKAKKEEKEEVKKVKVKKSEHIDLNYFTEVRKDLPEIKPGDVTRVSYRVIEGGKERIQVFEGTVIAIKNAGISKTFTVRKTSFGIAVERIFPLNSKLVQGIEVKKHSKVRRAKLYYLRNLRGKAARLKELR